jgi:tetratricopeptide (TPR) repeat protein
MWRSTPFALALTLVAAVTAAQSLPKAPRPPAPPTPPALPALVIPPDLALKLDGFVDEALPRLDVEAIAQSARAFALDANVAARLALAEGDLADLQGLTAANGQVFALAGSDSADYERGTSFLDSGRYDRAIESFDQVISKNGKKADGAMYWKAYALQRLGKRDEAIRTIEELLKKFPSSRWSNDAKALLIDVRQASGQPVSPDKAGDEELKLIALNGLMTRSPDQAIPMIEQMLTSSASPKLKERGLFVLAQSASPRARTLLGDVAKGKGNPDLQLKALDYLGAFSSGPDVPLLVDVYRTSGDVDVKKRVIRSLAMTGRRAIVFDGFGGTFAPLAFNDTLEQTRAALERVRSEMERNRDLNETERQKLQAELDRELSRMSDRTLRIAPAPPPAPPTPPTPPAPVAAPAPSRISGTAATERSAARTAAQAERDKVREAKAKEASDALWQLYQGESSVELRREILRNMRFSTQVDRLAQIAKTDSNPDLRAAAIQGLMFDRTPKSAETLLSIYQTEKDPAVRRQIVDNISASGSAATLVQMARQEKDPTLRKRLVERLSMMKDKEAVDYMVELLRK